jgi:class 3 adenylate cyclase
MISGICTVLMADSRGIAEFSERVSPVELVERLSRATTAMVTAVEKNGGIVHQYVGGSLIAYWPPEKMPAAARDAIGAAVEIVVAFGVSVAVGISVADLAVSVVGAGSAGRSMLVGPAYQRAEETIRTSSGGRVAVDMETLRALPADIRVRFVPANGHAEFQ